MSLRISHVECTAETYVYMCACVCVYVYMYTHTDIYIFNSIFKNHAGKKAEKLFCKKHRESIISTFFTLESKLVHKGKLTSEKEYGSSYEILMMPSSKVDSDQKTAEHLRSQ